MSPPVIFLYSSQSSLTPQDWLDKRVRSRAAGVVPIALEELPTGEPPARTTTARKVSRAESAYAQLKAEILSCRLMPGTLVFATELAERLEMSPTPVHEALKALAQEGLVRVIPRRGYIVTPISPSDIQDNFRLRLNLEVLGAELAAEQATPQALAAVQHQHERARAKRRPHSLDDPAFVQLMISANQEFHTSIAALSGNKRLERIVAGLLDETQRTYFLYFRQRSEPATADPHGEILRAIAAKDPNAAREAMAAHLLDAHEAMTFAFGAVGTAP